MNSSETDIQKGKMGDEIAESNEVIISENTKTAFETMKITNLNTDCMEHVCKYLEFNDLMNIADSSNQFYSAVCRVYVKKYQNMKPMFDRRFFTRLINSSIYYIIQYLNRQK